MGLDMYLYKRTISKNDTKGSSHVIKIGDEITLTHTYEEETSDKIVTYYKGRISSFTDSECNQILKLPNKEWEQVYAKIDVLDTSDKELANQENCVIYEEIYDLVPLNKKYKYLGSVSTSIILNGTQFIPDENDIIVYKLTDTESIRIKYADILSINDKSEVCYWRKFNALHRWFVVNCQNGVDDCGLYNVSKDKLYELLNTLKQIDTNNSLSEILLPTQGGFFFGGVEYDEWYFNDIKQSIEMLSEVLNKLRDDEELMYHSSW